jgi:hypothetical protein
MDIKKFAFDMLTSFGFGELMEGLFPKAFDPHAKEGEKTATGGMKSGIGGIGVKDEAIVLLGDYSALPEAWRKISLEPATISLIAEAFRDELTPLQRGKIERICGLREDTTTSKEYWLDREGKKVDDSAPQTGGGKGQPKGPQKVTKVVEKEMQNQTGRNIMVLLFAIGCGKIGKEPGNQNFSTREKTPFKKTIASYLKNRGILRDFSDQADEMAKEAEETARAFLNRLGVKGNTEELREHSEDFLQAARLRLEKAKAR